MGIKIKTAEHTFLNKPPFYFYLGIKAILYFYISLILTNLSFFLNKSTPQYLHHHGVSLPLSDGGRLERLQPVELLLYHMHNG